MTEISTLRSLVTGRDPNYFTFFALDKQRLTFFFAPREGLWVTGYPGLTPAKWSTPALSETSLVGRSTAENLHRISTESPDYLPPTLHECPVDSPHLTLLPPLPLLLLSPLLLPLLLQTLDHA